MKAKKGLLNGARIAGLLSLTLLPAKAMAVMSTNAGYVELDILADTTNSATHTDPRLLNAWGIVVGRNTLWVNDNHSGLGTTYNPVGQPLKSAININQSDRRPRRADRACPDDTAQFVLTAGSKHAPSTFLSATEDGTIVAWNQTITGSNAVIVADRSGAQGGAIYKGLAIARDASGDPRLYAANFHAGFVDVFDGQFNYVMSFTDTNLPANYAPFNIKAHSGQIVCHLCQAASSGCRG